MHNKQAVKISTSTINWNCVGYCVLPTVRTTLAWGKVRRNRSVNETREAPRIMRKLKSWARQGRGETGRGAERWKMRARRFVSSNPSAQTHPTHTLDTSGNRLRVHYKTGWCAAAAATRALQQPQRGSCAPAAASAYPWSWSWPRQMFTKLIRELSERFHWIEWCIKRFQ